MTRHALPALAAASLLAAACSQPDAPAARATPAATMPTPAPPIAVFVQVGEEANADVQAWAEELRAAVSAGQGDLRLASTPEEAEAVVRIDSVQSGVKVDPEPEGEGETSVMRGALVLGERTGEIQLAYKGDVRPKAEAIARNLRDYAAKLDAAAADATESDAGAGAAGAPEPDSDGEAGGTSEPETDTEE
jgi:hypothetical protein